MSLGYNEFVSMVWIMAFIFFMFVVVGIEDFLDQIFKKESKE